MAVTVRILITLGNGLAPLGTTLEVDVVDVGAGVNNIDSNALTAVGSIEVLVEGAKGEAATVGDTSQTPRSVLLKLWVGVVALKSVNFLVLLDVLDL